MCQHTKETRPLCKEPPHPNLKGIELDKIGGVPELERAPFFALNPWGFTHLALCFRTTLKAIKGPPILLLHCAPPPLISIQL
ncbi:Uncharacterized protein TCM_020771 [Theobroma cacao]|uniref:Uncharacterized protein n=1 Tax=Theobroma cacao TaxID=3641 RepID=A0A061ELF3_THECC|nr:Uncharacterized protein TCM_020771 [Theobroma cacao]